MRRGGVLVAVLLLLLACRPVSEPEAKLKVLEEVLRARNDNDPRLDSDFNALAPEAKRLFRLKYAELPAEARNDRGTIVYLLGKNLSAPEDWAFLRGVAGEAPCLSLEDCARKPSATAALGDEVTLAYPSLVALKQAQRALEAGGPARPEALSVLEAGKASKMPAAAKLAARLERSFAP